jgi:hypothetical protein
MLNKITWSSFLILLALIIIGYYLYVLIVYYRKDIFSVRSTNKKSFEQTTRSGNSIKNKTIQREILPVTEKPADESFTLVHELLEDLKDLFLKASRTKMVKEELLQAIRTKLKTYPGIGETELQEDIKTHIVMEAKDQCGLEISPVDMKQIWD